MHSCPFLLAIFSVAIFSMDTVAMVNNSYNHYNRTKQYNKLQSNYKVNDIWSVKCKVDDIWSVKYKVDDIWSVKYKVNEAIEK